LVVAEDLLRAFGVAQRADLRLDRLGRDGAFTFRTLAGGGDAAHAAGEEVLQLERSAVAVEIFVAGDAADRALVHVDLLGNRAQGQRPELRDAVAEETVLCLGDRRRDLENGPRALVER